MYLGRSALRDSEIVCIKTTLARPSGILEKKIGKLCCTYKKLPDIAQHYESTIKMAFFICFCSVLAVLATILKISLIGICHAHCVL